MEREIRDHRYDSHPLFSYQIERRHWLDVLCASPVYVAVGMLGALTFLWFIGGR